MKSVFVDTLGWYSLRKRRGTRHTSTADVTRFLLMRELGLRTVLTQDNHFPGTNNSIHPRENDRWPPVDYILKFVQSDDPRTKLPLRTG